MLTISHKEHVFFKCFKEKVIKNIEISNYITHSKHKYLFFSYSPVAILLPYIGLSPQKPILQKHRVLLSLFD